MMALFRAELRKLLTVRSTYIISALALVLVGFLAFYVEGFRGMVPDPGWLASLIENVSTTISIFVAIVAILLMGHEYRHNTIMYTLTSANSRTKVLLAKIITVMGYAVGLTVIAWLLAVLAYWLGTVFSPYESQMLLKPELHWDGVWRGAYFVVGFGMIGLLLAFLFRHLVGAVAALFILPIVEGVLTPLLKDNTKYLPFSTLEQIHTGSVWAPTTAAFLFLAYMVAAWLVTWYLFTRRDAN